MKCKECYKKNFYLARDMQKIYKDFEKRIDSILPKRKEFFILDSGHLPHMENPNEFNKILLSILN